MALAKEVQSLLQGASPLDQSMQQSLIRCLTITARCHVELADYTQAVAVGKQAIELGKTTQYTPYLGVAYGLAGYANSRMDCYVEALHLHLLQQQTATANNDRKSMAEAYNGRALVYTFMGDPERAIVYFRKSLQIAQEIGEDLRQITQLNNISCSYLKLQQPEQALAYGLDGLKLSEGQLETTASNLLRINVAAAYLFMNDTTNAEKLLALALAQARRSYNRFSEMYAQMEYGRLFLIVQQPAQAIAHLEQALEWAMHDQQKLSQYEVYELLAQAHKASGNPAEALAHYEQFYTIRESVLNQQNQLRLAAAEFENKLELAQRQAELSRRLATDLEEQVRMHTADLQAALARETELARKLEYALERESELQALKTRIINTASHEFRTPLSIIDLTTNLLFKRLDALSKTERETYRERIRSQVFNLKEMLVDVLTVNTSTSMTPLYISYQFADFCQQLKNNLATELQGFQRVSMHYGASSAVLQTDLDLVQRVVFNLTTNALKFSAANTPVELTINPNPVASHVEIRVKDYGIGIPPADLPHIFTMFYRASNIDSRSGLGLGLSVVHKIVTALQGTVAVESTALDNGSTFCVTLPFRPQN
ncbi:MAG: tetratricopeptide repeat-containing sensor histidine kinase [Caldilineaceae bacterium]